jgi:gamma-glutamyltranspeptidase / glutathione hydrolase
MHRAPASSVLPRPAPDPALAPPRCRARPPATASSINCGVLFVLCLALLAPAPTQAQQTFKPPLHGQHWMALTGKPLAATTGAMIFQQGGNAVDAAVAMLGATSTMWDVLGWGGETQALIYNPGTGQVIGVNGLGFAPTGATPEFFHRQGMHFPPEWGPQAAVVPGTPGAFMVMLAEFGRLSLAEVLAPSIQMADGYPIEAQTANSMERSKDRIKEWDHSRQVFLPHLGSEDREAPYPGEIFRQEDLATTLRKLVEAEGEALAAGATREEAIMAAYDRFYRGDIAEELVRSTREAGGLLTMEDLDRWEVKLEEPVSTTYRDLEVYKLDFWTQGPVMLQTLNLLENADLKAMGFNSARYIHALYQAMNLAFADRDFYYGDPAFEPRTPGEGLLSKEYARDRWARVDWGRNDPEVAPGDPYPYQGETNPFLDHLREWTPNPPFLQEDPPGYVAEDALDGENGGDRAARSSSGGAAGGPEEFEPWDPENPFYRGTTAIQTADAEGWVVSVTPSGGWIPAFVAGRTGIGLSQRMQSFVTDPRMNPYNVLEPGKRPRVTLTPSMALKDGRPFLSFAVQGGDGQDQNLLQMLLNVVEWGMTVQEAAEAPNINSFQMRGSFGDHVAEPGRLLIHEETPSWVQRELRDMGYDVRTASRTSGPLMGIWFDHAHGTFWGGVSHHGEDHGIAW